MAATRRNKRPTPNELAEMLGRERAIAAYHDAVQAQALKALTCVDPRLCLSQEVTLTIEGGQRPSVTVRVGDGLRVPILFSEELRAYLLRELQNAADAHEANSAAVNKAIEDYGTGKRKPRRDWRGRLTVRDQ